ISLFGMPDCIVKSRGLKWELDDENLSFTKRNSHGNRSVSSSVELKILSGKAMVFIYAQSIIDAGSI
ncbi:MAG: hypothetical protein LBO02_00320, partial [Holosporaceae bacterium]|nr:hypothetical protein [Holosporaceae bacterium]